MDTRNGLASGSRIHYSWFMTTTPFITAEHTTNPRPGVWVLLTTMSIVIDGKPTPSEFVITTSTGYRATLSACMSDRCTGGAGDVVPLRCVRERDDRGQHSGQSIDAWCKHVQTHCHGPHIEHAEAFAAKVAATYGSASKRETTLTGLRSHPERVRNVSVKAWVEDPYATALEGWA
jgi:hypothetical protein